MNIDELSGHTTASLKDDALVKEYKSWLEEFGRPRFRWDYEKILTEKVPFILICNDEILGTFRTIEEAVAYAKFIGLELKAKTAYVFDVNTPPIVTAPPMDFPEVN